MEENENRIQTENKPEKPEKNHNKRNIIIAILLTAILSSAVTNIVRDNFLIYMPFSSVNTKFTDKLSYINKLIKVKYLYDVDENELSDSAIKSYVDGLEEPYTHYYNAKEFSNYTSNLSDSYIGIGIVISRNDENRIVVVSPFEDSNAYNAGIKPGDILVAVDGKEYSGDEMEDATSYIKGGKKGTSVTLTIERDGNRQDISVERGDISADSVKTEMLDNNVGYVRITAFNTSGEGSKQSTYTEFKEKIDELQSNNMQGMIIDLRDNPGGSLSEVCNIADMIVPEGLITYMEYKNGKREEFKSDANEINIPISIIINGNSASASEVLTGCLKDYKKAVVVGTKSFGKGIVQTVYPFMDGSGMSMTVAKYYSPNGVCIHGTGIEPDIEVELPEKYKNGYASAIPRDEDIQFMRAVESVRERMNK